MRGKSFLGIVIVVVLLAGVGYYLYQKLGPFRWSGRSGNYGEEDGETLYRKGLYEPAVRKLQEEISVKKGQDTTKETYFLSLCYGELGKDKEKKDILEAAVKDFQEGKFLHMLFHELGHIYVKEGKSYEARNALSNALRGNWTVDEEKKLKLEVTRLSHELMYSPRENPDSEIYIVKRGDTVGGIARKYGTTPELIGRVNRLRSLDQIRDGDRLKIIKGKFHIEIRLSQCVLTLYLNDHFIKEYSVGVGKPDTPTPPGEFTIASKLIDPPWWNPPKELIEEGESYIAPGDPRNILGSRWMGFEGEWARYGIHGTTQPETIGKPSSDGCIRMNNEDVEELFDFVPIGTKVIIRN